MTDSLNGPMTEESLFELLSLECLVDANGAIRYYNASGKLHRVHGPAVMHGNGRHDWYQNGRLHRLDGPATISADGYRAWFQNGQRHRLDGPAIEYADGSNMWCQNGRLHRLDGPAIECPDGAKAWHINGKELTEAEWQQAVSGMEHV